ncbi:MAG: hypothetical protein JO288_15460 [Hyphomicrobiales bacterium]|nr:hypothetical protein [Hyphomicrobiales bacterium]
MRISALNWSPLTTAIKDRQFHDDDQIRRSLLNGRIKTQLMNDGLSDAVLFLGGYQPVMRQGVIAGICAFLEGDFKNGRCDASWRSRAPVAFISESLGSYMLFDAIRHMEGTPQSNATSAAVSNLLAQVRVVYMFANQIPLLELAEPNRPPAGAGAPLAARAFPAKTTFGAFLDLLRQARAPKLRAAARPSPAAQPAAPPPPVEFVAFTDPNDILSYQVRPSDFPSSGDQTFTAPANVLSPNEVAWFDLVADPVSAHNGYSDNSQVIELVVCGTVGCAK